jgi:hypothetical protein
MTEQILSNAKTNFDIHLNNAITKRNYVSRMKKFMKYCQVESYDELDLTLVKFKFELLGLRIDTLAFAKESTAFVIIEYKEDRNFSIVDQGLLILT